ncbi:MAG: hypothetical protein ABIB98_01080 [bacterium]
MHSILIFGGTKSEREQKILDILSLSSLPLSPDIKIVIPKKSIGIDAVREIEKFLIIKPIKLKRKIVIINSAQNLTIQAQNALLKTLEEPPGNSQTILEIQNEDNLLPTIISRCQKINLGNKNLLNEEDPKHNERVKIIIELLDSNEKKRLDYTEINKQKLANKEYAWELLDASLSVLRDKMLLNENPKNADILNKESRELIEKLNLDTRKAVKLILLAEKLRENLKNVNVSPRLTLDIFLINID